MKNLFLLIAIMGSVELFADPVREVISCGNEHYRLVLRDSAVVTYKTGTLSFSNRTISMACKLVTLNPTEDQMEFTCEENRAGDGRFLAGVTLVGEEGTAEISHEQIHPLKPHVLADLRCRVTYE
ncbi:MAG: hypothetical protein EB078_04035 [Proteobacteria bacterium]|nr:hypothetical protein [Pseudomonadota bacterium]NDC24410.1 hypothetical protein [Pseudomonadota bacterium]NDD04053.1 hypothetical protein [Pseudomonadota bacterium]NDG26162.1 hypothetical protein [Pseudomonadota bacterium]